MAAVLLQRHHASEVGVQLRRLGRVGEGVHEPQLHVLPVRRVLVVHAAAGHDAPLRVVVVLADGLILHEVRPLLNVLVRVHLGRPAELLRHLAHRQISRLHVQHELTHLGRRLAPATAARRRVDALRQQ